MNGCLIQLRFQQAEVKPQAIEWILSVSAGVQFRVSIDNLDGAATAEDDFNAAVHAQVKRYCQQGLSDRATLFRHALCQFYKTSTDLKIEDFDLQSL